MIIGVGTDLVEMHRVKQIGVERLTRRILTEEEVAEIPQEEKRRLEWSAGRFAAKEAIAKAAGCGIGSLLSFKDIRIETEAGGRPTVWLSKKGSDALGYGAGVKVHLSITHSRDTAAAFAVIEQS
ncbi:holo-ACP synthase [Salinithrix halophila]|uniref:Holo-[acyl-carrier-protein] synthase n=1 Tax=Salinithrix halophila TaxID=1485204 RepID=A0ABV8JC00_9BACL